MKTKTNIKRTLAPRVSVLLLIIMFAFNMQTAVSANNTVAAKSAYLVDTNRIWLNVTGSNGAFSQTLFGYRTGATDGFDSGLDGAFWNDGAISLASMIGDVRYAIQFKGLPFSNADVVPLSFSAIQNGTYTFAIDHTDGFFLNQTFAVYLHDRVTNTYTNLKTGNYTFSCTSGTYNNRFQLTYATSSTSLGTTTQEFTANNLEIYHVGQDIVVKLGNNILNSIQLYTMNGQLVYENKNIQATETILPNLNISQQTIVVKATTNDGITINKKWLYL
jgi:hypothetical protein